MSVGCKIIKDFDRPSKEKMEQFRNMPVANIDDCMGRTASVCADIMPLGKEKLLGPAFTVKVPQGDNLMFHMAMDLAKPGDIIVIDAGGFTNRAIFGELMATYCKIRGIKGLIVDGAVRDSGALAAMGNFAVYARGVTPDGPYKNGPGEINTPIVVGGRLVCPGDIVVGDDDGVIFIKPEDADSLAAATKVVEEKEAGIMKHILEDGTYDRPWVMAKLQEIGCEIKEK